MRDSVLEAEQGKAASIDGGYYRQKMDNNSAGMVSEIRAAMEISQGLLRLLQSVWPRTLDMLGYRSFT
jgi:hypothetical protein